MEGMASQYTKEARETIVHGDREDSQCSIGMYSVVEVDGKNRAWPPEIRRLTGGRHEKWSPRASLQT